MVQQSQHAFYVKAPALKRKRERSHSAYGSAQKFFGHVKERVGTRVKVFDTNKASKPVAAYKLAKSGRGALFNNKVVKASLRRKGALKLNSVHAPGKRSVTRRRTSSHRRRAPRRKRMTAGW